MVTSPALSNSAKSGVIHSTVITSFLGAKGLVGKVLWLRGRPKDIGAHLPSHSFPVGQECFSENISVDAEVGKMIILLIE
jgi:hypothetical protein